MIWQDNYEEKKREKVSSEWRMKQWKLWNIALGAIKIFISCDCAQSHALQLNAMASLENHEMKLCVGGTCFIHEFKCA